jgi:ADP-heptose:LPS heptosyltransferase
MLPEHSIKLIQELSKHAVVLNASHPTHRSRQDTYSINFDDPHVNYFRRLMALIYHCDYFVGVCSVGQHIAYALEKDITVVTGSTDPVNISYPNAENVNIMDMGEYDREYSPIRITGDDRINRKNENLMSMTQEITDIIVDTVSESHSKDKK